MNNQLNHINKNSFWGSIIISIIPVTILSLSLYFEGLSVCNIVVIMVIIFCIYFLKFRQDIIIDYLKMKQDEELTRNR